MIGRGFDNPADALAALLERLSPLGTETVPLADLQGRILAETIYADRDSPACDVSAMDGYAVRIADLKSEPVPVAGSIYAGSEPGELPRGQAMYITTGAALPAGADAVVRVEDTQPIGNDVRITIPISKLKQSQFIRRQGENRRAGAEVFAAGTQLHPPSVASMAGFGKLTAQVHRRVRVGILTTGDEVLAVEQAPRQWQLRNSNQWGLWALASRCAFASIDTADVRHVADDPETIQRTLSELLDRCDAVILSGGVSMGNRDFVPGAIQSCGCETVFHKLPVRPGKPTLAAVGPKGQLVMGLPGNPVSVLTTACRFVGPALRKLAGLRRNLVPSAALRIDSYDGATLDLWWWRQVTIVAPGVGRLIGTKGSGDVPSAGQTDGFVEIPPGKSGEGPWPFYSWEI